MADFFTSAGFAFSVSAGVPATFNQAGYEALAYTEVGGIESLGDLPSTIFQLVTFQPLKTRGVQKAKGGKNMGSQSVTGAVLPADAGQALLAVLAEDDDLAAIKMSHPDIGTFYAQALVMEFRRTPGDVNTPIKFTAPLEFSFSEDGSGFVIVAA